MAETPNTARPRRPRPTRPPQRSVGELVFDVSENTSTLIREEIELAKAEVSEKVGEAPPRLAPSASPPASSPSSP